MEGGCATDIDSARRWAEPDQAAAARESKQSDIDASPKGERFGSESMRRADRDFRYHLKASKNFLMESLAVASQPLRLLHPFPFLVRLRLSVTCLQMQVSKIVSGKIAGYFVLARGECFG